MSTGPRLFSFGAPKDRSKVARAKLLHWDGSETEIDLDEHSALLALSDLTHQLMSYKYRQVPRA